MTFSIAIVKEAFITKKYAFSGRTKIWIEKRVVKSYDEVRYYSKSFINRWYLYGILVLTLHV